MYKAVLWDFGGVLTTSPFEAFNRFESERNLPQDFIRSINSTNPETNAWAYNVAHYQLVSKKPVLHGQAVGRTREDWVRVYHLPSALDEERTVLYLDFDEGK